MRNVCANNDRISNTLHVIFTNIIKNYVNVSTSELKGSGLYVKQRTPVVWLKALSIIHHNAVAIIGIPLHMPYYKRRCLESLESRITFTFPLETHEYRPCIIA